MESEDVITMGGDPYVGGGDTQPKVTQWWVVPKPFMVSVAKTSSLQIKLESKQ